MASNTEATLPRQAWMLGSLLLCARRGNKWLVEQRDPAHVPRGTPSSLATMKVLSVAIFLAAFAVSACGGGGSGGSSANNAASSSSSAGNLGIASTDRSGACAPSEARRAFASFLAAFNHGNYARLESLFAAEPAFGWFSSNSPGRRIRQEAERRSTLIQYIRQRHSQRDRLRLARLPVVTAGGQRSGLGLELWRSAADFRNGKWSRVSGKASLVCHEQSPKFLVMSLGAARAPAG